MPYTHIFRKLKRGTYINRYTAISDTGLLYWPTNSKHKATEQGASSNYLIHDQTENIKFRNDRKIEQTTHFKETEFHYLLKLQFPTP